MQRSDAYYRKKLWQIVQSSSNCLRAEVAGEALEYEDSIENFFAGLFKHGCQSGMIGKLIYYYDTHKFFDTHYHEIEELREELEEALGEPLQVQGDLKNWYAWMAFEETARIISINLGLDN